MSLEAKRYQLPEAVVLAIKYEYLGLYQRAANDSGYEIQEIAKPGESFQVYWPDLEQVTRPDLLTEWPVGWGTIRLVEGRIGIAIVKPNEQENHSPFFRVLEALEDQP